MEPTAKVNEDKECEETSAAQSESLQVMKLLTREILGHLVLIRMALFLEVLWPGRGLCLLSGN